MLDSTFSSPLGPASRPTGGPEEGMHLLEIAVSMTLVLVILLGVMASISSASFAERSASEGLASQMLMNQVIEEVQASPFDSLLSFNGQFVTSGVHRADITTGSVNADLVQIQVVVTSTTFPDVTSQAVILISDTD
jgi:Tfp pilus assembly protein PilV